ncbi:MAG: hypothetical protein EP341_04025 [Sphingomonadales bacterium]|nr:MAG: hypothetical protein EP341_04025 [Sphingomonadales bacterium]
MVDRIIDARNRFRPPEASPPSAAEIDEQWKQRSLRQQHEAAELRKKLISTVRLEPSDRKILARNLGRAIERKVKDRPTQIAGQLFRTLYGEEGGVSKEKKRKRYIRFDGEPLNDHGPGEEYAARGQEFLRIAEGLADILEGDLPKEAARDQMLLFVCDGASFYGPSRPRLHQDVSLFDKFRQTIDTLIDRIVRETDIVEYFEEMQNYTIRTHSFSRSDCAPDVLARLNEQMLPIERFEHFPGDEEGNVYEEYARLRLGGFDIRAEGPSPLLPRIRLARVYLPRKVLCLPAFVETKQLEDIRKRPLSTAEIDHAMSEYKPNSLFDKSEEDIRRHAIQEWRDRKEHSLWRDAIKAAGLDPDALDWSSFEDDRDGSALNGAEWRTFWQAVSVDLYLVADGSPDALHFGLRFPEVEFPHWTDASKDLEKPSDDIISGGAIENCVVLDEHLHWVPWFPSGKSTYVCRGYSHNYLSGEDREFPEPVPDYLDALGERALWPLQAAPMWHLLTMKMIDWQAGHYGGHVQRKPDERPPSLRSLFDAPKKWTPAPDGSLASAILSSLAYGEGCDRFDEKIIAAANNMVGCFRDVKQEQTARFDQALSDRGYE